MNNNKKYSKELEIDTKIFPKTIILKTSYEFNDKADFSFKTNSGKIIIQITLKNKKLSLDDLINDFNQELIFHSLREDIDKKTSKTRFKIIETALGFGLSLDKVKSEIAEITQMLGIISQNDTPAKPTEEYSLENIIKQIENDPEFAEDKDEIISILKDIKK